MSFSHNIILNDDLVNVSKMIQSNSVDCVIADFPYNIGKDFGNNSDKQEMEAYIEWSKECTDEFERVLKPSGTGFIYGFSEILERLAVNLTLEHRWLIWHYTNKNTATDTFWQRSHEGIIAFWKDKSKRIFNADEVREPYTEQFLESAGKVRKGSPGRFGDKETIYKAHENGALGRDVIKVSTLAGGAGVPERIYQCKNCGDVFIGNQGEHEGHELMEHPTQKPYDLTEKLLRSCLPLSFIKRPLVYIPFAGSGSECLCCCDMGVDFISCDINKEYAENANKIVKKYGKVANGNTGLQRRNRELSETEALHDFWR